MKAFFRAISFIFLLCVALYFLYQANHLVKIISLRSNNPEYTAMMKFNEKDQLQSIHKKWSNYPNISRQIKKAVLAAEDSKFMSHYGFDFEAIESAAKKNMRYKRVKSGGSTITQQLAKNIFLTPKRSFYRKIDEAFIALMMEMILSKERIFELYLNNVEWGKGIYGIEAASQHYYGVKNSQLDAYQAARLASMLTNPRRFQKNIGSNYLDQKTNIIFKRMESVDYPH